MSEDAPVQIDSPRQLLARALQAGPIAEIAPSLDASGADVHLVGGAVRDLILGREFIDVDLAVDGEVSELAAALGGAGAETRFGTVSLQRGGYRYDLARTRAERYEWPGALPQVEPAGILADLSRRDFTVNAIALGLAGPGAGRLLTASGALDDLQAGQLAVLHDDSFADDPTRLLRLARYAARLGFELAGHTRKLAELAIADGALQTVSAARIGNELRLMAREPDPVAAFRTADELGLPWAVDAEPARRALEVLPAEGRADLLVLALVLAAEAGEELDALGFTAGERQAILEGRAARDLAGRLARAQSNAEIARAVGTAGIETVALAFSHGRPPQALTWLQNLRHRRLAITGDDLIAAGIPEGPRLGQALQAARDALMNSEATDHASQLRVALSAAQ